MRAIALTVTAVLMFAVTGTAVIVLRLQGNVTSADITDLLGKDRPTAAVPDPNDPNAGQALNIMLMGSDWRGGQNAAIGGADPGMRSDTAIVMHLSADRKRIDLVSIPRDTIVDIPACTRSDGTTRKAHSGMFNSAFGFDPQNKDVAVAAACTVKTVEAVTHVRIDDFVVVDFVGFITMVDALGGVQICVPTDIYSPDANNVRLTAGLQTLNGALALDFARARKGTGLGDGSDTNRIGRQHALLAAMVRKVQSKNLLTNGPALLQFLNAATSSVTASPDLADLRTLTGLALSLRGTSGANITFMTIPWSPDPTDPNRVVMTADAAGIWADIAQDKPVTPGTQTPAPTTTGQAATTAPTPTKTPGKDAITADDVTTSVCG